MRKLVVALAFLAIAAAPVDYERANLLNISLGGSVVSRSGDLTLDQSALRAIDGVPESAWNSPPNDGKQQTLVFALPAIARVEKIGLRTPRAPVFHVGKVQFDSSTDGVTFIPIKTVVTADKDDLQLFDITPRNMLYIRVTTLEANGAFARIESVQARGQLVQPVAQIPLDGCWTINGLSASFHSDRGRVTGTIGGSHVVSLEGGSDGAVFRFVWISGPDWGFGAINSVPDGKHLSGLRWYVEPIEFSSAESWFGERSACGASVRATDTATTFMQRAKRLPLYGLRFGATGELDETHSAATLDMLSEIATRTRFRLVSREFRQPNDVANKQRAQQKLNSLRTTLQKRGVDVSHFDWIAMGSDAPPRKIESDIERVLYGTIELQPL